MSQIRSNFCPRSRRGEQGGVVILVALMLLALLSVAAFSLGRSVIREIGISGNVYQAGRADAASDAGLDWFIAWENYAQLGYTIPATAVQALDLTRKIDEISMGINKETGSSELHWAADVGAKNALVLQGASLDGTPTQSFNLQLLCLGQEGGGQVDTSRGNPSGGKNLQTNNGLFYSWEVISTGQAIMPGDAWRHQSIRGAKVLIRPLPSR